MFCFLLFFPHTKNLLLHLYTFLGIWVSPLRPLRPARPGLAGHRLGQQGLSGSRRAHQQRSLGDLRAELRIPRGVLQEIDHLHQFRLCSVAAWSEEPPQKKYLIGNMKIICIYIYTYSQVWCRVRQFVPVLEKKNTNLCMCQYVLSQDSQGRNHTLRSPLFRPFPPFIENHLPSTSWSWSSPATSANFTLVSPSLMMRAFDLPSSKGFPPGPPGPAGPVAMEMGTLDWMYNFEMPKSKIPSESFQNPTALRWAKFNCCGISFEGHNSMTLIRNCKTCTCCSNLNNM